MKWNNKNRKLSKIRTKNALRAGNGKVSIKFSDALANDTDARNMFLMFEEDILNALNKRYPKFTGKILGSTISIGGDDYATGTNTIVFKCQLIHKTHVN